MSQSEKVKENGVNSRDVDEDSSNDVLCGIGSWRPQRLQRLANHKVYAFAFVIIGIVQGMIMSYFSGVLTTIEKVFSIQSSVMGMVMSGNDISQILGGLIVNHFGTRGSRPTWVAIGMVTTGASCFMYAAGHLMWDRNNYVGLKAYVAGINNTPSPDFCSADSTNDHLPHTPLDNRDRSTTAVLLLFFGGQLISGIGSTALFSLGFTYMDDSVKKSVAPLYTGVTTSLRSFGPVLGFVLASFCLGINVIPTEQSQYTPKDPLYIGAWWLGFLILGSLQVLITFPMLMFPRMLPSERARLVAKHSKQQTSQPQLSGWQDFKESLKRVLKNPVVIAYLLSIGPIILSVIGSAIFLPKYMEAQFGQTARQASMLSGMSGMATIMIGTFLGGLIMWKFKPPALYVALFAFVVDSAHIVTTVIMMFMDCGKDSFTGVELYDGGNYLITSECSRNCSCRREFNPVCIGTSNYLSPCLAGCTGMASNRLFQNCTCAAPTFSNTMLGVLGPVAQSGFCPGGRQDCPYLAPYLILNGATKLLGSISRIGFILIMIRSVEKRDKSLVMALMMIISSLTGFVPGPIVFGAAVDKTCLIWDEKPNGQRGNCWVYDSQQFSYWFHGIKITCYIFITMMSLFICYYGRRVNLYEEDEECDLNDGHLSSTPKLNNDIPLEAKSQTVYKTTFG